MEGLKQISRSDPHFVVFCLENLLPQMAVKAYTENVLEMLPQLCEGLKKVGHLLEANYKDKLDQLQHVLTEFCKDGTINMVLRLRVLEIIELRTMGWRMSSTAEEYYTTKIAQFQKREESKGTNESVSVASSKTEEFKSTKSDTVDRYKVPNPKIGGRSSHDELRFKTSVHELFPDRELKERECVVVDKVKIFLYSSSTKLLKEAKIVLMENFNKRPSFSNIKYSREDLLDLKRSPPSSDPPLKWSMVTQSCPEIITYKR